MADNAVIKLKHLQTINKGSALGLSCTFDVEERLDVGLEFERPSGCCASALTLSPSFLAIFLCLQIMASRFSGN